MADNDGREEVEPSGNQELPAASDVQNEQPAKSGAAAQQEEAKSDRPGKPRWTRFERSIFIIELLTLASLIAYTVLSGLMWREMRSSNASSNKVADAALKVAEASEKVAKATSEWATESGRALRQQNRLAGNAVAEARKQSASATKQADVAAQAVEEGRQQAEASRRVLEQSLAIADKSFRLQHRVVVRATEIADYQPVVGKTGGIAPMKVENPSDDVVTVEVFAKVLLLAGSIIESPTFAAKDERTYIASPKIEALEQASRVTAHDLVRDFRERQKRRRRFEGR